MSETVWLRLRKYIWPGPSGSSWQVQKCYVPPKNGIVSKWLTTAPILAPPDPGFRVRSKARGLRPDQVNYWEGALQLFFLLTLPDNDWPLLQKYMGPRSFQIQIRDQKMWSVPTKTGMPYNFCFIKFLQSQTVETAEAGQTLFRAPWHWGWGYGVSTRLGTFPALRSISMPNFIKIGAVVWISIADIHAHTLTFIC